MILKSKTFQLWFVKLMEFQLELEELILILKIEAQIRSISVEEEWQGKGIGSIVLKELEKIVIEKGAKKIIIHARNNAVEFYKKNGYKVVKQSYTLFGSIPHFLMEKTIELLRS